MSAPDGRRRHGAERCHRQPGFMRASSSRLPWKGKWSLSPRASAWRSDISIGGGVVRWRTGRFCGRSGLLLCVSRAASWNSSIDFRVWRRSARHWPTGRRLRDSADGSLPFSTRPAHRDSGRMRGSPPSRHRSSPRSAVQLLRLGRSDTRARRGRGARRVEPARHGPKLGARGSALIVLALFFVLGRITLGAERRAENDPAAP